MLDILADKLAETYTALNSVRSERKQDYRNIEALLINLIEFYMKAEEPEPETPTAINRLPEDAMARTNEEDALEIDPLESGG